MKMEMEGIQMLPPATVVVVVVVAVAAITMEIVVEDVVVVDTVAVAVVDTTTTTIMIAAVMVATATIVAVTIRTMMVLPNQRQTRDGQVSIQKEGDEDRSILETVVDVEEVRVRMNGDFMVTCPSTSDWKRDCLTSPISRQLVLISIIMIKSQLKPRVKTFLNQSKPIPSTRLEKTCSGILSSVATADQLLFRNILSRLDNKDVI